MMVLNNTNNWYNNGVARYLLLQLTLSTILITNNLQALNRKIRSPSRIEWFVFQNWKLKRYFKTGITHILKIQHSYKYIRSFSQTVVICCKNII